MRVFDSLDDLRFAAGTELGISEWHPVTQQRIDAFAEATGDHQWIHVDAERAAAGPFGTTIAHGFLSLALTPLLVREIYEVRGLRLAINYGANRVRFPAPLPSNSEVRARARRIRELDYAAIRTRHQSRAATRQPAFPRYSMLPAHGIAHPAFLRHGTRAWPPRHSANPAAPTVTDTEVTLCTRPTALCAGKRTSPNIAVFDQKV